MRFNLIKKYFLSLKLAFARSLLQIKNNAAAIRMFATTDANSSRIFTTINFQQLLTIIIMDFILLQSFDSYIEAHILLGRLQEEGITCWLKDENTVTINPIWSNAVGGIKLMVADDQIEKATDLLSQFQEQKRKQFSCPYCGSNNIEYISTTRKAVNWLSAILTWSLGSYAIGVEQVWHCFNCSKEFKEPVESKNEETFNEEQQS